MQIKNRLFPYPVLNNDVALSSYKETAYFAFEYDVQEVNDKSYVIKNARYELVNKGIAKLINQGKAEAVCVIECSETMYREKFDLSEKPRDILIDANKLNGKVFVSAFIYAKEDIYNYEDEDLVEEYEGYKFNFRKYDFLAVDDGVKFRFDYPEENDDKVSSIFIVVRNPDKNEKTVKVEAQAKKIQIVLPYESFSSYESIKDNDIYKKIFFSILVVPALTSVLEEVKDNFEEAVVNYGWMNSICHAYKNKYNMDLTSETIDNVRAFELSQMLMGFPIGDALEDLFISGIKVNGGEDDE